MNNETFYQVDVLFEKNGVANWVTWGTPEKAKDWDKRLDALQEAKRIATTHNKRTRVAIGNVVHGFVEPSGAIINATEENEQRWDYPIQ